MRSPPCQMDQNNLARVFGPTVVGHGMSEPTPSTIMRDTNTQPKVLHQKTGTFKKLIVDGRISKHLLCLRSCPACWPSLSLTGEVSSLIQSRPVPPLLAPTTRMVDKVGQCRCFELSVQLSCSGIFTLTPHSYILFHIPGRLFKPLTSPELNSYYKSTSRGSLRGRIKNLGHAMATT